MKIEVGKTYWCADDCNKTKIVKENSHGEYLGECSNGADYIYDIFGYTHDDSDYHLVEEVKELNEYI